MHSKSLACLFQFEELDSEERAEAPEPPPPLHNCIVEAAARPGPSAGLAADLPASLHAALATVCSLEKHRITVDQRPHLSSDQHPVGSCNVRTLCYVLCYDDEYRSRI